MLSKKVKLYSKKKEVRFSFLFKGKNILENRFFISYEKININKYSYENLKKMKKKEELLIKNLAIMTIARQM